MFDKYKKTWHDPKGHRPDAIEQGEESVKLADKYYDLKA